MRSSLGLLLLGLVSVAHADPVADLAARLNTLDVGTPVKGVLEADYQEFDDKGVADQAKSAHLQLDFDSSDGLSIHLNPVLLQSLSVEEAKNVADPVSPTPQANLLREMSPTHIQHVLSAADGLLRLMNGGSLSVAKAVTLDGAAVTQLDMNLPLKATKKDADAAKDYHDVLSIWIDNQGIPLRFLERVHGKFCKFFLCVSFDESFGGDLKLVGGRLVDVTYSHEHQQSGLGQDAHTRILSTLKLQ